MRSSKRRGRREYSSTTALVDMTSNMLLLYVGLFTLAFVMMNYKVEAAKKIDAKAEFIITITWPETSRDDVDSYVEDPLGNLVFFRSREKGLMHLDRDDLGYENDRIKDAMGKYIEFKENREIVTIRGIIPGEYVVNAHMYRKINNEGTPAIAKLEKLNPYSTATISEKILQGTGDEVTFFRFYLDKDGNITDLNEIEKPLARQETGQDQRYGPAMTNPYGDEEGVDNE